MNLRHLHYLQLLVREGSFAAAARAAGVSQPAVTQAMHALEHALGLELFEKHGNRKLPNRAALLLAQRADELDAGIAALGGGDDELDAGRHPDAPNLLRVGLSTGAAMLYGALIVSTWRMVGGHNRLVQMTSGSSPDLLEALQRGELDFVITPRPRGRAFVSLTQLRLFSSMPAIYARTGHPLANALSLSELKHVGWVVVGRKGTPGDMIEEAYRVRRLGETRIEVQCADYATLLHLVAHSDLMGVIPHAVIVGDAYRTAVQPLRVREGLPRYDVCLFRLASPDTTDPAMNEVVTAVLRAKPREAGIR